MLQFVLVNTYSFSGQHSPLKDKI